MALDDGIRAVVEAIAQDMKVRPPSVWLTQEDFDNLPGGPVAGTSYFILPPVL